MKYKSILGLLAFSALCLFGCSSSNGSTVPASTAPVETKAAETTAASSAEDTTEIETEVITEAETEEEPEEVIDLTGTWICENGNVESEEEIDPYRRIIVITEKFTNYFFEEKESGKVTVGFIGHVPELINNDNNTYHYKSQSAWIIPKGNYDMDFTFRDLEFDYSDEKLLSSYTFEKGEWQTDIDFSQIKTVSVNQDEFFNAASLLINDDYNGYLNGKDSVIGLYEEQCGFPEGLNKENLCDSLNTYMKEYNTSGLSIDHDFPWLICQYMTCSLCMYFDGTMEEVDPEGTLPFRLAIKYPSISECTADELIKALEDNPLRASNTYKEKYILLYGYLNNIDSSGEYINLRSSDKYSFANIQCFIKNEEQVNRVMDMNIGDQIALIGKVTEVGELMGYLIDIEEFL